MKSTRPGLDCHPPSCFLLSFPLFLSSSLPHDRLFIGLFLVTTIRMSPLLLIRSLRAEYGWSVGETDWILAAPFLGGLLIQPVLLWIGAKRPQWMHRCFSVGVFGLCLLSLISPPVIRSDPKSLGILFLVSGAAEGVLLPATLYLLSVWTVSRSLDITLYPSLVFFGGFLGILGGMISVKTYTEHGEDGGGHIGLGNNGDWEWIFYLPGLAGIPYLLVWNLFAASHPTKFWGISEDELRLLLQPRARHRRSSRESLLSGGHTRSSSRSSSHAGAAEEVENRNYSSLADQSFDASGMRNPLLLPSPGQQEQERSPQMHSSSSSSSSGEDDTTDSFGILDHFRSFLKTPGLALVPCILWTGVVFSFAILSQSLPWFLGMHFRSDLHRDYLKHLYPVLLGGIGLLLAAGFTYAWLTRSSPSGGRRGRGVRVLNFRRWTGVLGNLLSGVAFLILPELQEKTEVFGVLSLLWLGLGLSLGTVIPNFMDVAGDRLVPLVCSASMFGAVLGVVSPYIISGNVDLTLLGDPLPEQRVWRKVFLAPAIVSGIAALLTGVWVTDALHLPPTALRR